MISWLDICCISLPYTSNSSKSSSSETLVAAEGITDCPKDSVTLKKSNSPAQSPISSFLCFLAGGSAYKIRAALSETQQ
jgi:hypothetical protein